MQLSIRIISPELKGTLADQAESCIEQIQEYLSFTAEKIIGLTVYVNSDKQILLEQKQEIFEHLIKEKFGQELPTSFIAEPCVDGLDYLVEIHLFEDSTNTYKLRYKSEDELVYALLESDDNGKFIFASGIAQYYKNNNVIQSAELAFQQMLTILKYEGMNMSHIFRQWNYIEGIVQTTDEKGFVSQNYQDFNDVRATYYDKVDFVNGYPAATGIGTKTGGINIGFYAYKGPESTTIRSVINPLQTEAFDYSDDVLIGDKPKLDYCKAAPKFDRAKYLGSLNNEYIFISGTAAIRGEETLAIDDASKQTEITIDNMLELLKLDSLKLTNIHTEAENFRLLYIKVYVKNKEDKKDIEAVCNNYFPKIPKVYVIADVCRDNLLVEIEGIAEAFH